MVLTSANLPVKLNIIKVIKVRGGSVGAGAISKLIVCLPAFRKIL
jgi:hypothetical protein